MSRAIILLSILSLIVLPGIFSIRQSKQAVYDPLMRSIYVCHSRSFRIKTSSSWMEVHTPYSKYSNEGDIIFSGMAFSVVIIRNREHIIYPPRTRMDQNKRRLQYRSYAPQWSLPVQDGDLVIGFLKVDLEDTGNGLPTIASIPETFRSSHSGDYKILTGCLSSLMHEYETTVRFAFFVRSDDRPVPATTFYNLAESFADVTIRDENVFFLSHMITFAEIPINMLEDATAREISLMRYPSHIADYRAYASLRMEKGNIAEIRCQDGGLVILFTEDQLLSTIPSNYGKFHLESGIHQRESIEINDSTYAIIAVPKHDAKHTNSVNPFVLYTTIQMMGDPEDFIPTAKGLLTSYCGGIHVFFTRIISESNIDNLHDDKVTDRRRVEIQRVPAPPNEDTPPVTTESGKEIRDKK